MGWGAQHGGLDIEIRVIQGRDLVAKDRSKLTGRKTTSDPYVTVVFNRKVLGRTHTVGRTLNPKWWHDDDGNVNDDNYEASKSTFYLRLGPEAATRLSRLRETSAGRRVEFRISDEDKNSDDDPMGVAYVPLPVPPPVSEEPEEPKTITERGWCPIRSEEVGTDHYCKKTSGQIEVMVSVRAVAPPQAAQQNKTAAKPKRSFSLYPQKRQVDPSAAGGGGSNNSAADPTNKRGDSVFSRSLIDGSLKSIEEDEERRKRKDRNVFKAFCLLFVLPLALVGIVLGVIMATKSSGGGGGQTNGAAAAASFDDVGGNWAGDQLDLNLPTNVETLCTKDLYEEDYDACYEACELAECCFVRPQWREGISCSDDDRCEPYIARCKFLNNVVFTENKEHNEGNQRRGMVARHNNNYEDKPGKEDWVNLRGRRAGEAGA